jgi:hypothetical protein
MFSKILHANDGSEHAFHALAIALALAKQNNSDFHMVSVEEIDYMPEFIEEVSEETGRPRAVFTKSCNALAQWPRKAMSSSIRMSLPGIRCESSSNLPRSSKLNCSSSAQPAIRLSTNA